MLAAKAALAIRYDALGEDTNAEMGAENRAKLEARLRQLEERGVSQTKYCYAVPTLHLNDRYKVQIYLFCNFI